MRARTTDPATSHEAANALTDSDLRGSQQLVLSILRTRGPNTDEGIAAYAVDGAKQYSGSRLRTARKELQRLGLVKEAGHTRPRAYRMIVWEAVCTR